VSEPSTSDKQKPSFLSELSLAIRTDNSGGFFFGVRKMKIIWEAIETAPKDRRILLHYPTAIFTGINIIFGSYDFDSYAKKPKPHWRHDLSMLSGKNSTRENQPDAWAEIE
jgi:hypothetical protein